MAGLSCSRFLFLALAFFLVVLETTTVADGAEVKRCSVMLSPTGCTIAGCQKQCYDQKGGNGVCSGDGEAGYACWCVFPCPPAPAGLVN